MSLEVGQIHSPEASAEYGGKELAASRTLTKVRKEWRNLISRVRHSLQHSISPRTRPHLAFLSRHAYTKCMKLDMIGIVTKNIGSSLEFYRALGLDTRLRLGKGEAYVEMTLDGGLRASHGDDLEMVKEHDPNWEPPSGQRLGMAFLCDGVADVGSCVTTGLAKAGYVGYTPPFDAFWGPKVCHGYRSRREQCGPVLPAVGYFFDVAGSNFMATPFMQ